jgi:hypothetical protein
MTTMLRRPLLALSACVAALALPLAAKAQDAYFGPQVGFFFPRSSVLQDALGDSWFSFGASRMRVFKAQQGKLAYDWNAIGQKNDGSTVFILTGSVGFVVPLSQQGADFEPYVALRAGLAYIDYAVDTSGGRESGKVLSPNANAALGFNINRRVNLEVRYDVWSSYEGLTFDGLTLALRVGLFRF